MGFWRRCERELARSGGVSQRDAGSCAHRLAGLGSCGRQSRADQGARKCRIQDRSRRRPEGSPPRASQRLSFGRGTRFGVRLDARAASGRHRSSARDSLAARPRFRSHCVCEQQCTADRRIRVDRGAPTRIGRKRHRRRRCRHRGAVSDDRRHRRAHAQPYRGLAAAGGIPAPRLGRRGAGGGATALGPVLGVSRHSRRPK